MGNPDGVDISTERLEEIVSSLSHLLEEATEEEAGVVISKDLLCLLIGGAILAMQQRIQQGDPGYVDPPDREEMDNLRCDWTYLSEERLNVLQSMIQEGE